MPFDVDEGTSATASMPFEHAMEDTGVTLLLNTFKAGRFFSDVKKEHRGVGLG